MARIRTVKPEFFVSESVGELSLHARLTFIGLWTYVDDQGRAKNNPRAIRGALWPNDEETVTSADVTRFIDELEQKGMVCRYTVSGANHLHVVNMHKHQTINRPSASKLPACPIHDVTATPVQVAPTALDEDSAGPHGGVTEDSRSAHGGLTSGSGMEVEVEREVEVEPAHEAPKRGKPRTTATEAPEHFEITRDLAAWALKNNLGHIATEAETERFLLHHRSHGNKFKNWNAAWQKWMSKAAEYAAERSFQKPPPPKQTGGFANTPLPADFAASL